MAARLAPYLNPVIDVVLAGRQVGRLVARLGVSSDLCGKADTCVLLVADGKGELERAVKRSDPLVVRWGYAGDDLTEIFRGVVREAGLSDPLVIRGIDHNAILNARRVTMTFEDETASGVVRALLAGTGLGLAIEECDLEIDRLPLFNRTLREGIEAVTEFVRLQTGEEFGDYIREGVFHWGRKRVDGEPVHAFRSGVDIISLERSPDGLTILRTIVVPVRHSEVVTIDGDRFIILRADYTWRGGGRTTLACETC